MAKATSPASGHRYGVARLDWDNIVTAPRFVMDQMSAHLVALSGLIRPRRG